MTGVRAETVGSPGSPSSVEAMRIAGERVHSDRVIEVRYPWTGEVIATVPRATVDQVRDAFAIAHRYVPVLSRHERNTILSRTAALVAERRDAIAHLVADLKRQMPADVILSREMIVECPLSDASAVNDIVD